MGAGHLLYRPVVPPVVAKQNVVPGGTLNISATRYDPFLQWLSPAEQGSEAIAYGPARNRRKYKCMLLASQVCLGFLRKLSGIMMLLSCP